MIVENRWKLYTLILLSVCIFLLFRPVETIKTERQIEYVQVKTRDLSKTKTKTITEEKKDGTKTIVSVTETDNNISSESNSSKETSKTEITKYGSKYALGVGYTVDTKTPYLYSHYKISSFGIFGTLDQSLKYSIGVFYEF
jgi:hypothetical protein